MYTSVKSYLDFSLFPMSALLLCTGAFLDRQTDRGTEGQKSELTITQTDERTQRQSLVENQYLTSSPHLSPFVALLLLYEDR